MVRVALCLVLSACAARPLVPPHSPATLRDVQVAFNSREAGALSFEVELPPGLPSARALSWELSLDDARLASGVEGVSLAGVFSVQVPLPVKHLGWREGEREVLVLLRGAVLLADGARVPFREMKRVTLSGQPVLNVPGD